MMRVKKISWLQFRQGTVEPTVILSHKTERVCYKKIDIIIHDLLQVLHCSLMPTDPDEI